MPEKSINNCPHMEETIDGVVVYCGYLSQLLGFPHYRDPVICGRCSTNKEYEKHINDSQENFDSYKKALEVRLTQGTVPIIQGWCPFDIDAAMEKFKAISTGEEVETLLRDMINYQSRFCGKHGGFSEEELVGVLLSFARKHGLITTFEKMVNK